MNRIVITVVIATALSAGISAQAPNEAKQAAPPPPAKPTAPALVSGIDVACAKLPSSSGKSVAAVDLAMALRGPDGEKLGFMEALTTMAGVAVENPNAGAKGLVSATELVSSPVQLSASDKSINAIDRAMALTGPNGEKLKFSEALTTTASVAVQNPKTSARDLAFAIALVSSPDTSGKTPVSALMNANMPDSKPDFAKALVMVLKLALQNPRATAADLAARIASKSSAQAPK